MTYDKKWYMLFIGLAILISATAFAGEACFVYYAGDQSGNRPTTCTAWTGCRQASADGRCAGYFEVVIGDVTTTYAAMGCNNATELTYNKCKDYPEAQCLNDGILSCLSYSAYMYHNCTGHSGTMVVVGTKCKTKF